MRKGSLWQTTQGLKGAKEKESNRTKETMIRDIAFGTQFRSQVKQCAGQVTLVVKA